MVDSIAPHRRAKAGARGPSRTAATPSIDLARVMHDSHYLLRIPIARAEGKPCSTPSSFTGGMVPRGICAYHAVRAAFHASQVGNSVRVARSCTKLASSAAASSLHLLQIGLRNIPATVSSKRPVPYSCASFCTRLMHATCHDGSSLPAFVAHASGAV